MNRQYRILSLIVLVIILLSFVSSLIVKTTWFRLTSDDVSYIGIAAPFSGSEAGIGLSMERGAQLFLDELNTSGNVDNRIFELIVIDDGNTPSGAVDAARKFMDGNDTIGVMTAMGSDAAAQVSEIYGKSDLSVINTSSLGAGIADEHGWLYSPLFNISRQTGFTANYVRNVLGKKIITIVHSDSSMGREMERQFNMIYARFGTKIHYTHEFKRDMVPSSIETIIDGMRDKKDIGTIFFAGDAYSAAHFLVKARDAGIKNMIVGTDVIATTGFTRAVTDLIKDPDLLPKYTDGMLVSVPLLFDTSGGESQRFKNQYMEKYGTTPDWIAAYAYDAAKLMIRGIFSLPGDKTDYSIPVVRNSIKAYLDSLKGPGTSMEGATGETWFTNSGSRHFRPVQMGIYNGSNIIAAPIQLQPMKPDSSVNYFDELKSGRMLYVNDRFMYKTSVIYTGVELHSVMDLDMNAGTATLDLSIWFRYKGKFNPADIEFLNAAETVELDTPLESTENKDISFRLYRLKAPFKFDFLDRKLPYGKHVLGLSFHHRTLNRNNVIYVVDVLGMEFDKGATLKQQLDRRRALHPSTGRRIEQAWLSQRIFTTSTLGSPVYVGYGTADPEFSRIDYGAIFSEDRIDFRSLVEEEYLIYIGIFGLIGSLAARIMDRRLSGFFWRTSSWIMRLVFWPLLLLSCGNLVVNTAIKNDISIHYINQLVMYYDMCWWLLPATLLVIAMERFFWIPLEGRTKRKVPNLIRHFTAALIYVFAFCGIVAFVWHQTLTSLLATSGLFAMIIGLAVQGNIANVFSGIIINLDRPFSVGDWIKINEIDAVNVVDMTWRTIRLETLTQHVVFIPNGRVADSVVVNYSKNESIRIDMFLHVSPKYKPSLINKYVKEAIAGVEGIDKVKAPANTIMGFKPVVNKWVGEYVVRFWVTDWKQQFAMKGKIWIALWERFDREGITFNAVEDPVVDSMDPSGDLLSKRDS
ncbi:MAG: ABC transporter substrate-binding protein [Desulfamplus sp.]|nr:ABC transporter substrate-binding protein [Desulfamplus sp.]